MKMFEKSMAKQESDKAPPATEPEEKEVVIVGQKIGRTNCMRLVWEGGDVEFASVLAAPLQIGQKQTG